MADQRRAAGVGWQVWRATVGVFYLAAGGFTLVYTLPRAGDAGTFDGYADGAWLPILEELVRDMFIPNAVAIMAGVVVFEVAVGALILGRGRQVDVGVASAVAWVVALLPFLAWPYLLVNVGLAAGQGVVALRRYERAAWELRPGARTVVHR